MAHKICVVDDTPDLLENVCSFLEMEGFEVWKHGGSRDALAALESRVPDLIITDLWMPVMSGLAFIAEVRKDTRLVSVPVIIFSAKPVQEYEKEASALGISHFIKKPSALEDILRIINLCINP